MEQEKLETRILELFEEQGFEVSKDGNRLKAENGKTINIAAFSSNKYSADDVTSQVDEGLVFVDEPLAEVQDRIDNDVSIIREKESDQRYELPSYELVGDIAVINELVGVDEDEAVEGILQHHSHVKTVLLKEESLGGEFRVGSYRKLHGEETETIHKEFGCRFRVDPTKVYFSERFSTERNRVVSQIKEGERVLVMFAGVGPFAIMAAKNRNPEKVVAVEKNPAAANYLKENIELNSVEEVLKGVKGDVEDIVPELDKFDRIMMPLPGSADEFLDLAIEAVKEGGTIHYYRFVEDEDWSPILEEVEDAAKRANREFKILDKVICGHKGPGIDRACIDILVE